MTDLVEAVARAMCNSAWECDGEGWDDASDDQKGLYRKDARAVIPVVLERAAEVAGEYDCGCGPVDCVCWHYGVPAAIRGLGE